MVCANCGKECLPSHKFCSHCGALQPIQPVGSEATAATAPAPPPEPVLPAFTSGVPAPPAVGPPLSSGQGAIGPDAASIQSEADPAPYASFTGSMLTALVCASIALFLLVQAAAVGFTGTVLWTAGSLAGVACVVAKVAVDKFHIIRAHPDAGGARGLIKATFSLAAIFFLIAGVIGCRLGGLRAQFKAMTSDWAHLVDVEQRISGRRDQIGEGIPSLLATYQAIAPDVKDLNATITRLLKEEEQYRQDYPDYQAQGEKEIADLRAIEQRTKLLQQQVDIARKMSSQDERQRVVTLQNELRPVLDQEIALTPHN